METNAHPVKNHLVVAVTIFSVAMIIVASVIAGHLYQAHSGPNTITVTGSTQQVITSDEAQWQASFYRTVSPDGIKLGTTEIKNDTAAVLAYLHANGITDDQIALDPLSIGQNYSNSYDEKGNSSQVFTGYTISQSFTVQSNDIDAIGKAATNSGSLIAGGILFQTSAPQYYYSKLADLKIQLVSAAAADAKNRAQKIADNSGSTLGGLRSASMGIVQITPVNSSDVSEDGYYDTSSIKKQVTIIVHETFFVL